MARAHKQMPGRTYSITYLGEHSAKVDCTYRCPYCGLDTTASFKVKVDANVTNQLEQGGFFRPLNCDLCGKVADVRFWQSNKV